MKGKRGSIEAVPSSVFGRSLALFRLSAAAGASAVGYAAKSLVAGRKGRRARRDAQIEAQLARVVEELGRLKGSLMKVGQLASMYGDYFLPPKLSRILRHLQADSPPLAWPEVEAALRRELGERLNGLTVDREPLAAASLGQVHKARYQGMPEPLCLKVQYPGMDAAIASDLTALAGLLKLFGRGPYRRRFAGIQAELSDLLRRELDYHQERLALDTFRRELAGDLRYRVPKSVPELSTGRVLAATFQDGVAPDDPQVLALPQSRRNALGTALLELYFREIFTLGLVQTDPHFGNYKVELGGDGEPDRLVLLDFGSMRAFPPEFVAVYGAYVGAAYREDRPGVVQAAIKLGLLQADDPEPVRGELVDLACLFMEPLRYGDKSEADQVRAIQHLEELPTLIAAKTRRLIERLELRPPPREMLLLDRKLMGIFVFLATIRALVPGRELIDRYLPAPFPAPIARAN
jgi:predicted unusual protein kinase regulating ubiquinone biosynthesis (AarF/ABC1/UbiB family)